ncbi:MAG: hemolysin family protein [Eubacteriales bacterium]|nr:hemolysin family protein [Eubacteriales bacterium]MDD3349475.1 hemolysin family protein [Eubacteriales bacterium]
MDPSPDPSTAISLQLLFLAFLILINAFFSAAEMAIVSVNKNKLKVLAQAENQKAMLLLKLLEQPNRFLSTIQVAITLAGFLASASAATSMADDIGMFLGGHGVRWGTQLGVVVVTFVLSYVTLVFGELFPKRLALQHSEKLSLASVKPILLISRIAAPFVWFLSVSVTLLLKITRQNTHTSKDIFSEDEVMSMLEVGQETGFLKEEGAKMINSIFAFDDKLAYEVMTPRTDVFTIDIDDPEDEYVDELMELKYSRIPVYEDDSDNIIGILNIKDYLIKARNQGFKNVEIRDILRKPYFVPDSKNIDDLFRELQASKQHIAILIDEYGGFSGIVTMEDLIEEIMGDISDEYDEAEQELQKISDSEYLVEGLISLDSLNEALNLDLSSENCETLGGFLLEILGEIPQEDVTEYPPIEYKNYSFKIEQVLDRRIEQVRLTIQPEENTAKTEE